MPERYPNDLELLTKSVDEMTGVEYIPTGASPYVLAFRRLVDRLLRTCERANDLRVYAESGLQFGVRSGRCRINNQPIIFEGIDSQALSTNTTSHIWIDTAGDIQIGTDFPADPTSYIALASLTTDDTTIIDLQDRRGESFLQVPTTATLGLTAAIGEINQALDGISPTVSALSLNLLTQGPTTSADLFHRHVQCAQDVPGLANYALINHTSDPGGNYALVFFLPALESQATYLELNKDNYFLQQRHGNQSYNMLGALSVQQTLRGNVTSSINDQLLGAVPVAGTISALVISASNNMVSDDNSDGIAVSLKVNGQIVTTTAAKLTAADGSGFVCTDQGDGTQAVLDATGLAEVQRGDVLHFDLTYTTNGTVTMPPSDVVITAIIRAAQPE